MTWLTEQESEALDHAIRAVRAVENWETARLKNDAHKACLNGGPKPDQAMVILQILNTLLTQGQLTPEGIDALMPVVEKLEAIAPEKD